MFLKLAEFSNRSEGNVELISVGLAMFPKSLEREWKQTENLDFFDLKRIINRFFHATALNLP
jgi:hypothetical protein